MSLLQEVSSVRIIVSGNSFINTLNVTTLQTSTIDGGNVYTQPKINSTIQGLGSLAFISTPTLVSSLRGLGTLNYISAQTLVSTVSGFQRQYQTASFLSSANLQSSVTGLASIQYISSASLQSTVGGLGQRYVSAGGAAATTPQLISTFSTLGINTLSISSLNISSMNRALVQATPNSSIFVFTGEMYSGSNIKVSVDNGSNWLNVTSGAFSSNSYAVGYNGSMWVAVGFGNGNTIKYSYDAFNWYDVISGAFTSSGYGIVWNGRIWLALGASTDSSIKYSSDGLVWSNASSGAFTGQAYYAAWNGNMWVAVGSDSGSAAMKYSYDGLNWSNKGSGTNVSYGPRRTAVVFGKNVWVAAGIGTSQSQSIQYSYDGINWSNIASNGFYYGSPLNYGAGYGLAFNGNIFVAAGLDSGTSQVRYSYNGVNWYVGTGNTGMESIVWTGSVFVGKANQSPVSFQYSSNGITWDFGYGSPNSMSGTWLAFNSNVTPSYQQSTLQITDATQYYLYGPQFSSSLVYPQYGDLFLNDILEISRGVNRVGIGIYSNPPPFPRYTLDVLGSMYTSTFQANVLSSPSLNVSSIQFGSQSGWLNLGPVQTTATSSIQVNSALAYISSLYCGSTNTALPFYTAQINGTALVSSLLVGEPQDTFSTIGFRLAITHDSAVKPGTDTWTTTSDMRVKDNIVDADYKKCYSDIQSLQLRRFEWASSFLESWDGADRHVLGFIAQEVSTIFPQSVDIRSAHGFSNFHFLNLDQMNMSLYGAVKQTILDIETLESTVKYSQEDLQFVRDTSDVIFSTLEGIQRQKL